jgi:hypothetical protein
MAAYCVTPSLIMWSTVRAMSNDLSERLVALDHRAANLRMSLAELTAQRRGFVVAASDNDETATRKLMEADAAIVKCQRDLQLADEAREEIEVLQQEAQAEIAARDLERRQHEDREDRTSMMADATVVDQCANALTAAIEQYVKRGAKVKANGIAPSGYASRLVSKGCITSALNAAGLGEVAEVGYTAPAQKHPLAESCHGLFAKELTPTSAEPKQAKPQQQTDTAPKRGIYIG